MAVDQLRGIAEYISWSSPAYAARVIHRIESRLELPRGHPLIGKTVPEWDDPSVRELVDAPYRIFYRPLADCIEVLAIVHGRRHRPQLI